MAARLDYVTRRLLRSLFIHIALLSMIMGFSGQSKVNNMDHVTVQPCDSWDKALSTCKSSGPGRIITNIHNQDDYRYVVKHMTLHNISVTWLGFRRQHLGEFIWLDCSAAPTVFASQKWPDSHNCGCLNTRDDSLDADSCATQQGVICETKDCRQCTVLECVRVRGRCFFQTCTPMSWMAGRAYCRSRGWDLAVLGTEEAQMRRTMVSSWKNNQCRFYWVGLRREEWTYPNRTSNNVTHVYWGPGEPGLSGDCAIMTRQDGGHVWRAVSCAEGHQALCYHPRVGGQTDAPVQTCRTWQAASFTCDSTQTGAHLPVITNLDNYKSIAKTMNYYKINVTWLALSKRHLDVFLWLDCKPAPPKFTAQTWNSTTNCAFLNAFDDSLDADACSSRKGVVCELKGCRDCSFIECTRIEGRCFYETCTPVNWEAARAYCRSRGWNLAVLGNTGEGRLIREIMASTWKDTPCKNYWVGLRRVEWVYPNNAHLRSTNVYWDREEPRDAGNCSIMNRTLDGFRWRVADCNDRYPAICVKPQAVDMTSIRQQSPSKASKTSLQVPTQKIIIKTKKEIVFETDMKLIYILLPVAVILVIISIVMLIFIIRKRYPKIMLNKSKEYLQMKTKPSENMQPEERQQIKQPFLTRSLPSLHHTEIEDKTDQRRWQI